MPDVWVLLKSPWANLIGHASAVVACPNQHLGRWTFLHVLGEQKNMGPVGVAHVGYAGSAPTWLFMGHCSGSLLGLVLGGTSMNRARRPFGACERAECPAAPATALTTP